MCDFMPALLSGLRARDSGSATASRPAGLRSQPAGLARPSASDHCGAGCSGDSTRAARRLLGYRYDRAWQGGTALLDTAESYGGGGRSEELLGEVLAGRRDQVVLANKFGHYAADLGYGPAAGAKGGRAYIRRAVEQSLRRLRTDYIDLYQEPTPDPQTPIAETIAALGELVAEGKVRYIGHS